MHVGCKKGKCDHIDFRIYNMDYPTLTHEFFHEDSQGFQVIGGEIIVDTESASASYEVYNLYRMVDGYSYCIPSEEFSSRARVLEANTAEPKADWMGSTRAEGHLRKPRINCLESWYHNPRADRHLMRAVTTLSLTLSDGYCLFADPNPLPKLDHLHDWYAFWDTDLGKPLSPGERQEDGSVKREFSKGVALYNPMGNRTVSVVFARTRQSVAKGKQAKEHSVAAGDGDIFLKTP